MVTRASLAVQVLRSARNLLVANIEHLTLHEALGAAGGYRSILGIIKHIAGWSHVYRSYAFDAEPRHWEQTGWPRGLRDTIEPTQEYLDELVAWLKRSLDEWDDSVGVLPDADFESVRPLHWGDEAPLSEIVVLVAEHWTYHAGEINAILAVLRSEAWEDGEEVEENHIETTGHRVRPPWMTTTDSPRDSGE